jgi:hypothetical protein
MACSGTALPLPLPFTVKCYGDVATLTWQQNGDVFQQCGKAIITEREIPQNIRSNLKKENRNNGPNVRSTCQHSRNFFTVDDAKTLITSRVCVKKKKPIFLIRSTWFATTVSTSYFSVFPWGLLWPGTYGALCIIALFLSELLYLVLGRGRTDSATKYLTVRHVIITNLNRPEWTIHKEEYLSVIRLADTDT